MIVLLEEADETALYRLCQAEEAHKGKAGIIVVKESSDGTMLYWNQRRPRFDPFDEETRRNRSPMLYLAINMARKCCEQRGGQLALWLSHDFDWTGYPLISKVLNESGTIVVLSNGGEVSVNEFAITQKKLKLLDATVRETLFLLCTQESHLEPDEHAQQLMSRYAQQLLGLNLIDATGIVAPPVASIVREMLDT